jgi:hypothetical protein
VCAWRGWSIGTPKPDTRGPAPGEYDVSGSTVVLAVSLLGWVLLFGYLMRLDRRIRDLEKR